MRRYTSGLISFFYEERKKSLTFKGSEMQEFTVVGPEGHGDALEREFFRPALRKGSCHVASKLG